MESRTAIARALGLGVGVIADQIFADPKSHHPVAYFGKAAASLERFCYRDDQAAGAWHSLGLLIPLAVGGVAIERLSRRSFWGTVGATGMATWMCLGVRQLAAEGELIGKLLDAGDLDAARLRLPNLCGRDANALDESELARAAIESMAENAADAGIATLFWGALAGVPGLLVHRGANTLDAMIGHRNQRYENFGRFAAKLDDLLDFMPARITAGLAAIGSRNAAAWRIACRDHAKHPSPNGGWCEAAWAGALGVQLGGRNVYYGDRVEDRGLLGDGRRPNAADVAPAAKLVTRVTWLGVALAGAGLGARTGWSRR